MQDIEDLHDDDTEMVPEWQPPVDEENKVNNGTQPPMGFTDVESGHTMRNQQGVESTYYNSDRQHFEMNYNSGEMRRVDGPKES